MRHPRIWSRMTSTPWAIQSEALEEIIAIAERRNEAPEAVAARLGRELSNTQRTEIRDGVAVVPVEGPLFRYANLFTDISGASSYDVLARDFTAAVENPDVRAIVLNVDSPGGDANGVSEFADMIYQARGEKPIIAYVGGSGASAAYWIASAASEVVVGDTAELGSIGVVVGVTDSRDRDAKNGVKRYEIVSSQSPYKRVDPETDEGRAKIQERIDNLASVFVAKVARNRGVSEDVVLSDFGQGGIFMGEHAVAAGLADRVGSFEALLSELGQSEAGFTGTTLAPAAGTTQATEVDAMDIKTLREQHPGLVEQIETEARAGVETPDVAAAETAERERVMGILNHEEAQGREELAKTLASKAGMSVEDAVEILAASPKAKPKSGSEFADVMAGIANPDVASDEGDGQASAFEDPAKAVEYARSIGAIN